MDWHRPKFRRHQFRAPCNASFATQLRVMMNVTAKDLCVTPLRTKSVKQLSALKTTFQPVTKSDASRSWLARTKGPCTNHMACVAVSDVEMSTFAYTAAMLRSLHSETPWLNKAFLSVTLFSRLCTINLYMFCPLRK